LDSQQSFHAISRALRESPVNRSRAITTAKFESAATMMNAGLTVGLCRILMRTDETLERPGFGF